MSHTVTTRLKGVSPLNAELNPIRHLLALVGARHIVHVSRIRVKAQSVLRKKYLLNWSRNYVYFVEPDYLLSFSQELISCPYPDPTDTNPYKRSRVQKFPD